MSKLKMSVSMNGLRKRLVEEANNLKKEIINLRIQEDITGYYIESVKDAFNDVTRYINCLCCMYDDEVEGDFDIIEETAEYFNGEE